MTTATVWEPSRISRPSAKGCHLLKTARNAENAIFMQQLFFWFWLGTLGWFKKNRDAAPLSDWDEKAYVAAASAQEFSFVGGKGLETWRDASDFFISMVDFRAFHVDPCFMILHESFNKWSFKSRQDLASEMSLMRDFQAPGCVFLRSLSGNADHKNRFDIPMIYPSCLE